MSNTPRYSVTWGVSVDAESPQEAARKAWDLQRGEAFPAGVFTVHWTQPLTRENGEVVKAGHSKTIDIFDND